ncbi:MAG: penicillin-binding protein 1C [Deltaproteobacteria bacterium]|nr:penicillin-binding protein 1C [Deltaproteobacteria bacterium]
MSRWLRRFSFVVLGLTLGAALLCSWVVSEEVRAEDFLPPSDSVRIEARDGTLLRESVSTSGERRAWVRLAALSPEVIAATLAAEDSGFFEHRGVEPRAVARAMMDGVRKGRFVSGASTLTMQLSRLVHPHPRRTLRGKLTEVVDALRIERKLEKAEILEQYLNRAPYGAGATGVEAASRRYFGKPSTSLSLAEAALLAGLPKAPSELNPRVAPEKALVRRAYVLRRMQETRRAAPVDVERALSEPLTLTPERAEGIGMHFSELALARARKLGRDGGVLRTTLDAELQVEIERQVSAHVGRLQTHGLTDAAVVVLDLETCDVRALVGSSDVSRPDSGSVNGALSRRQPGSTLKPFTYALAFERGLSPAAVLSDIPTRYGDVDGPTFAPKNFDGEFAGPVIAAEALARSLNVPAIRLAGTLGAPALLEGLHSFGFDSLDQPSTHYGLGLTLGNGEVTLLELTEAYATLGRGGRACAARAIEDEPLVPIRSVVSSTTAALVTRILSDERLRSLAFGRNHVLSFDGHVALKTGTSSDFRDGWTLGFTDRFVVGVWVGDFQGRPMDHLAGVSGAGPLFQKIILATRRASSSRPLPFPALEPAEVCALSGHRPTAECPSRRTLFVRRGDIPKEPCPFHKKLRLDRRNGLRAGEDCPSEHVIESVVEALPAKFAAWQAAAAKAPPSRYSPLCPRKGGALGTIVVERPRPGETYLIEPGYPVDTQSVELMAIADPPPESLTWLVDGAPVATVSYPYAAFWAMTPGRHEVRAVVGEAMSESRVFDVR